MAALRMPDGAVFSLSRDNPPLPGCTISRVLLASEDWEVCCFSLAKGTEISAETFPADKLLLTASGCLEICLPSGSVLLSPGCCVLIPAGHPAGMQAGTDTVYTEIVLGKGA